ncbi:NAD(P)/FAD-dependent oxidoreductase [Vibrio porteresiae]|uniref:NAD(P)/FAD-dependent oxidoreductase n=1 Tax=Vibrio porteresiae DSM 19223 TaxID=1123496 RepID=A0ABZ0QKL5_9VIBR|nr:NAD(P)/FAD-dependent oxidoreductase [Vibrio porteresiae]WPC76350.1 NAD(P)/FAD-dependent oxidoreductase [Vibrio porteresiae DSM 19223]
MELFAKGNIGNMRLKNRVVMAPMGTKPEPDGRYSNEAIDYFVERAKGGTGLIITGANIVTTKYEDRPENELSSFHHVEKLAVLIERCHHYGTKVCVQLTPGLGRMVFTDPFNAPYSASSGTTSFWFPQLKCKELSVDDIHYLTERMAYSATLAKAAGADSVEIHGYGGYLMDQFHSSLWNKRQDQYGGSLENRLRFSLETIAAIRKACGPNFPIIMKYTAFHGVEGGRELDEGIAMAKLFEPHVDALHVDVGCYEVWYKAISTVYEPAAHQMSVTAAVKEAVSIPVIGQGKLNEPELAESELRNQHLDYVGLGHQLLADPHWANKAKAGLNEDIVPCIGCNECLHSGFSGKHYYCAVNPLCYAEKSYQLTPAPEPRSVLVIGGGPGGMQAAIAAAERGFKVELWEKSDQLGGNLHAAGFPTFKHDVLKLIRYQSHRIAQLNIPVKYHCDTKAEDVIAGQYDKVILATGSSSVIPPIAGIEHAGVANDYLTGKKQCGKRVVVIGGGLVGCEVAAFMAESADHVAIIEMQNDILTTVEHSKNNDLSLRDMLAKRDIQLLTSARVKQIAADCVIYEQEGMTQELPCDTVIIAAGYRAENGLEDQLEGKVKELAVVGDAVHSRRILDAVHEAWHAIRIME